MIRLALRVRRDAAELVLAQLLELVPAGVEEIDAGPAAVEYAVYGAPGELPLLPELTAAAGAALVEVSTTELEDDWQDRWRSFHRPVLISAPHAPGEDAGQLGALRVRPPWEPAGAGAGTREVVIDPGQAFGTGAHASTRLCLELLLALSVVEPARGALLDVGTGSGVLAIAGAQLGFAPVLALDNDPASIEAARANVAANRVAVEVRSFDLRSQRVPRLAPPERRAQPLVLAANLLRPLLIELARALPAAPGHLLAGGLLREEADEVVRVFCEHLPLRERQRRERAGWAAAWLVAD